MINDYLGSIDWDRLLFDLSVDEAALLVYDYLNYAIQSFVPERVCKGSSFPSWFSRELITVIKYKKRFHKQFKMSNSHSDYIQFSFYRAKCKVLTAACWNNYACRSELSIAENPSAFWKFVNEIRGVSCLPRQVVHENGFLR